jgi:ribosome-associated protein
MIPINPGLAIDEKEILESFVRAPGPGGQNVNKVATAVQLRFSVRNSPSLPPDVRERLLRLAGKRVNQAGILIIEANRYRLQDKNRQDARDRLVEFIRRAAVQPRVRRKTQPSRAAKLHRLETKRRTSANKHARASVAPWSD